MHDFTKYLTFLGLLLTFSGSLSHAGSITVLGSSPAYSVKGGSGNRAHTLAYDPGTGSTAIVVAVIAEASTEAMPSVTFGGVPLTPVIAINGSSVGIYFLNHPATGSASDLTFDYTGINSVNFLAFQAVSLSATVPIEPSVSATAVDTNVTLAVPSNGSFVLAGFNFNQGGNTSGAQAPMIAMFGGFINSGGGAFGYAANVAADNPSYSFQFSLGSDGTARRIAAVAFEAISSFPAIQSTSPSNGASAVPTDSNLVATFSEPVAAASGNIILRRSADHSTVETFDVATSSRLTFDGSSLTIDPTNELESGTAYHVLIDAGAITATADGDAFAGINDPAAWHFITLPDLDPVDGRMSWILSQNVSNPWPNPQSSPGWGYPCFALAALATGTEIATANSYLNAYFDEFPIPTTTSTGFDSYFKLHLIWRIYHDPAMNARLTPQVRARIETMMWRWINTRSKLSDANGSIWIIHDSENHDAMQKGGFLLCAEALLQVPGYGPDRLLADGHTLAEHAAAWTDFYLRYFPARAKEGINVEVACPIYAKYTVGVYYNIMDFAASPVLRELARRFIDLYWADTASDWTSSGVRGGAETRVKSSYRWNGTQYSFHKPLWGYGWHDRQGVARTYEMIPATSSYRIPAIITAAATDPARPPYLYTSRRFGRGGAWSSNRDYTVVFDSGNSNIRRDTWVTPDYTIGTMTVDMNRDYIALLDQNRLMGVFFASGPNDRVAIYGKPAANDVNFADLNGVCRENCLVVQRDKNASSGGNGTIVFFSNVLWNNRVENGGWIFSQSGDAYCAVRHASGGYTASGISGGMQLESTDMWAPIIVQMGQAQDYADFAAFQASVLANPFSYASSTLNYTSEAGDTFTVYANSKTTPLVNGTTVSLNPAKTYDSPCLSMVHGEAKATVSHSGFPDLVLDFDPASLPQAFSTWIAGYSVGGKTAPGDDPDQDGIPNAIENFFGTRPDEGSKGLTIQAAGGAIFVFTHPQNALPAYDLTATYRWSTDLEAFHDPGQTDLHGTTVTFVTQPNTPAPGITTVTAQITGAAPASLFVRVEVSVSGS